MHVLAMLLLESVIVKALAVATKIVKVVAFSRIESRLCDPRGITV
jgi:hypothetical protein